MMKIYDSLALWLNMKIKITVRIIKNICEKFHTLCVLWYLIVCVALQENLYTDYYFLNQYTSIKSISFQDGERKDGIPL